MGFELTTLVVIGTDCTSSCKSNYHTITTTMAPLINDLHICLKHLFNTLMSLYLINEFKC